MVDAASVGCIFDRDAEPDMIGDLLITVTIFNVSVHERTALGEYLIDMPVSDFHCVKDAVHETPVDILVKQVTHRVYEDHPRLLPLDRLLKAFWP